MCTFTLLDIGKALRHRSDERCSTHAYAHAPVREHEDVTVLLNQGVHTDRELKVNWQVIIKNKKRENMHNDRRGKPADRNVHKRQQTTNYNKTVYVQRYNKCVNIPVMTGATGTETKCLQKRLEAVPGNH